MSTKLRTGPGIGTPEPIDKQPGIGTPVSRESEAPADPQEIQRVTLDRYAALLLQMAAGAPLSEADQVELASLAAAVVLQNLSCPHCRRRIKLDSLNERIGKDADMVRGFLENSADLKRAQADKERADEALSAIQAKLDAASGTGDASYLEKQRNMQLIRVSAAGESLARNQCKVPTPGTRGFLLWQAFNRMHAAAGK